MLNPKDLFTYATAVPLRTDAGQVLGTSLIQYEIHKYQNIRNLESALAYVLICTHRVIVPNSTAYQIGPTTRPEGYVNYPAVLVNTITLRGVDTGRVLITELFPRTLNAAVSTSLNVQSGDTSSSSVQQSNGSNTSQTNTFGVSTSIGFFGEMPVGNLQFDYSHSNSSGKFRSTTTGQDSGHQFAESSGASMSVKDWSSYGYVDEDDQSPTWIWGQSFPWDTVLFNQTSGGGEIDLPGFVQARLMDSGQAMPPSQLSLFGLDFTMKAGWMIAFPPQVTAPPSVSATHTTRLYNASHSVSTVDGVSTLTATLQDGTQAAAVTYQSPALDLSTYGLDPIADASARNGAAVNFHEANLFSSPPSLTGAPFKILSVVNNLQVTGSGFGPGLTTDFSTGPASVSVQFKILDGVEEYALLLMHWVGASTGGAVKLSLTINGFGPVLLYVDAVEGQGGQNNVSAIELRNMDFSSINFHDYLRIGTNTIQIAAALADGAQANTYTLSALAVSSV
jgi:hypothetical protein